MTESETDPSSGAPSDRTGGSVEPPRRCLACGYDLRGQGEDLRCPECGLRNIPSAYRQQVWDLVDSGRWFFSGVFSPFRKRPPGWWWALDRPDDVRRSFKFAGVHVLVSAILMLSSWFLADAITVETVRTYTPTYGSESRPSSPYFDKRTTAIGVFGRGRGYSRVVSGEFPLRGYTGSITTNGPAALRFSAAAYVTRESFIWAFVVLAFLLVWCTPVTVGLWTQIRKGLPSFARAPRTIIAAGNYEAHRLTYLAFVVLLLLALDLLLRFYLRPANPAVFGLSVWVSWCFIGVFSIISWIGPLRSDYTRQLIRSPWHAVRIFVMYAVILPPLLALTIVSVIWAMFVCSM